MFADSSLDFFSDEEIHQIMQLRQLKGYAYIKEIEELKYT